MFYLTVLQSEIWVASIEFYSWGFTLQVLPGVASHSEALSKNLIPSSFGKW